MSVARYLIGDVFDVLATLDDDSVDLVLTSPPFLALRSYLPADHPDKAKEIGSEPTPAEFLDTLLALTAEWERVLAPHGSICVELGDTYSGSGGTGGDVIEVERDNGLVTRKRVGATERQQQYLDPHETEDGKYAGQRLQDRRRVSTTGNRNRDNAAGWPLDKSLCGIPHLYHLSLAYGRNLLTGEPSPAGQWRVRNVVAWCRPNPPVGALGDKFRPATSYMTVACKARDRWFDLDAVRTEVQHPNAKASHRSGKRDDPDANGSTLRLGDYDGSMSAGAPPLDWWQVSTEPYSGSHYATWPRKLLDRPIKAMCPIHVCTTCGQPRRRITEKSPEYAAARAAVGDFKSDRDRGSGLNGTTQYVEGVHMDRADNVTVGWSDCGCGDTWRNGIVLDPFAGSGTTLAVATGHGRDAIGIDLDERNAHLAQERIGMFLDITDTRPPTPTTTDKDNNTHD
jgi:hypothetical protein